MSSDLFLLSSPKLAISIDSSELKYRQYRYFTPSESSESTKILSVF